MIYRLIAALALAGQLLTPAPASSAESTPIRVGLDVGVNSLPFWIAMDKGFFEKRGLRVSDKVFDSGFLGLLAIGANEGDTSSQSDAPTLTLIGKGIDAVVVAVVARSADNYKIVGKNDIKQGQALKGRKVGMTLGSACEYVGLKYLAKQGLSRNDVNVVGADPSELAPLLARGDLDAACFWEPWGRKTVALAPTKLHVIGTGRDIYAVNMYLTVRRSYAKQHPESVKAILAGLQEANAYIGANKSEAIEIFRKKHRLDAEMANALVNEWEYSLVLDQQAISAMREVGSWLVENKKLGALPDWNRLIDASYLRNVAPQAVTYKP